MDCPLVIIRWEDSRHPVQGWQYLSHLDVPQTCECNTVGWLLEDGPERKVIAQSIGGGDGDAQAGGIMVIPARAIISVEPLD